MEDNFVNAVVELYKEDKWMVILNKFYDHPNRNKLLWVFPSIENLNFLKATLVKLGCCELISIGCGSGLLEWILQKATHFPVKGVEIDNGWWSSKYAPPNFIPLHFVSSSNELHASLKKQSAALLFCYFNDRQAFEQYLKIFAGNVLIIIGPAYGKGVHTDPKPFDHISDEWKLYAFEEVRDSKDFIAVHAKCVKEELSNSVK